MSKDDPKPCFPLPPSMMEAFTEYARKSGLLARLKEKPSSGKNVVFPIHLPRPKPVEKPDVTNGS